MYRWVIVHHVLHICFSVAVMSRAQGSDLPCLNTAAWEARPAHSEESRAIAAAWARLGSERDGW